MIADLQSMTEADLNKLSKAEILDHIMQERSTSKVVRQVGDKRGMLDYEIEHYDYKGKLTGSERTLTTYNQRGEVDVITKIERDGAGKEVARREIAHDGTRAWVKAEKKALAVSRAVEATAQAPSAAAPKANRTGILQTLIGLVKRS